jgi:hypothetical protein
MTFDTSIFFRIGTALFLVSAVLNRAFGKADAATNNLLWAITSAVMATW